MWNQKKWPDHWLEGLILGFMALGIFMLLGTAMVALVWLLALASIPGKPGVLGAHTYEIRENGLFESTGVNETLSSWKSFWKIRVTSRHLLLLQTTGALHIIPRRSFPDGQSFSDFVQAVRGHIVIATEGRAKV